MPASPHLEIVPLGGLGEFGMNLMVYRQGRDCIVVDAGMMFPGEEHLGVDVVLPDLSYLDECGTLHGLVLTHGHEDHIGAVPYVLARHDIPVYATPFTEALVRRRLGEHPGLADVEIRSLDPEEGPVSLGPFTVETVRVAHSIPDARMLVLRTSAGVVVHTADFKIDPAPLDGVGTDLERLAEIGREGVLALLSDSTNADVPGSTPGERSVVAGLEREVSGCEGRVFITTFASHVERLGRIAAMALRHGRRMALVGASIQAHAEAAERLGLLRIPPGIRTAPDAIMDEPPDRALLVVAGSQGEPTSSMARVAVGKHRHVEVEPGDLVIHAARRIPGNEKSIGRMIDHLVRRGADVVTAADAPVHVSGHGSRDELALLIHLLRPRYFVPIHGEYRQLSAHAALAADAGLGPDRVLLATSGDVIRIDDHGIGIVDQVHVGQVFVDATLDEVGGEVLRDRRRIAWDGVVVPVLAVHRESGVVNGYPEIVSRGFVPSTEESGERLMADARRVIVDSLADASAEERADEGLLRARIQTELRRFLRRTTRRQPLVVPVILEL